MKAILNRLIKHQSLTKEEARQMIINIADEKYNASQIASFLTVFMMRSITLEELDGFRLALLELCNSINVNEFNTVDLCGTGGDNKDTFNISTISSFIVAGAGIKVTKHGNYGVSSSCGSSNVLEALGIKFSNKEDNLKRCLDKAGICILHAPLFHTAMKNVAPIRRELGVKTFFNMLGPLVNPSFPKNQITGVYSLDLARLYGHIFRNTDKNFSVLYSLDGYDEVSLTNEFKLINNKSEQILDYSYFDLNKLKQNQIEGGSDIVSSAKIFMDVLNDNCTEAQKNVILANAALAIKTISSKNITECLSIAKESLESKKALNSFNKLLSISK